MLNNGAFLPTVSELIKAFLYTVGKWANTGGVSSPHEASWETQAVLKG